MGKYKMKHCSCCISGVMTKTKLQVTEMGLNGETK
jgi:hypothetical protein